MVKKDNLNMVKKDNLKMVKKDNLKLLNGFAGDFKNLKNKIHLKFIRYIDLFTIFFLILNKKLKIHNQINYNIIVNFLNSITPNTTTDSTTDSNDIDDNWNEIEELELSICINRFIENARKKYNFIRKNSILQFKHLTFSDFDSCNISIKREPFGLIKTISQHINHTNIITTGNSFNSNNTVNSGNSVNTSNTVTSVLEWDKNKIKKMLMDIINYGISSNEIKSKSVLVGVVSPFILNSHDGLISKFRSVRTIGTDEGYDKKWAYNINKELYTSYNYPLHTLFQFTSTNTIGSTTNSSSTNSSSTNSSTEDTSTKDTNYSSTDTCTYNYRITDLLCDIIFNIFENNNITKEHMKLIEIIKRNLQENTETTQNYGENKQNLQEINEDYEEILMKVSDLKPFPTIYWLMNRNLISRVSELEGQGLIKDIESIICSIIEEFHRSEFSESEFGESEFSTSESDKSEFLGSELLRSESHIFITLLILDNIFYMFRRFQFTHPILIESFYNFFVNSEHFTFIENLQDFNYINFNNKVCNGNNIQNTLIKGIRIMNTLRKYGIGGSEDFFHIKCLHTSLAYDIAEGSIIGSVIKHFI
uniref:Uncharacterized protein n=1 Tax=Theileria annulata TaxID=5874 RepID=A0A3B0MN71_THEAN